MKDHLVIRLSAPLMSFGSVRIDRFGPTSRLPHVSMITGLLANALGHSYPREAQKLDALQSRLSMTALTTERAHRAPTLTDLQTAGAPKSRDLWSPSGESETITTALSGPGAPPYLRVREYLEDAEVLIAISLSPEDPAPRINRLAAALRRPARTLFIGRKSCVPQTPIFVAIERAPDGPAAALRHRRLIAEPGEPLVLASSGAELPKVPGSALESAETSERNWEAGGLHGGEMQALTFTIRPEQTDVR